MDTATRMWPNRELLVNKDLNRDLNRHRPSDGIAGPSRRRTEVPAPAAPWPLATPPSSTQRPRPRPRHSRPFASALQSVVLDQQWQGSLCKYESDAPPSILSTQSRCGTLGHSMERQRCRASDKRKDGGGPAPPQLPRRHTRRVRGRASRRSSSVRAMYSISVRLLPPHEISPLEVFS